MEHFDIRKLTRLAYVVLLFALAIAWTGCTETAPPINGNANGNDNGNTNTNAGDAECGNGDVEDGEECEPPGSATCDADCRIITVGGAGCGDGNVDDGEECEPPNTATCDADCRIITVGGAECGDGNVDDGEECEPPNTATCDENCQTIGDSPVCGDGVMDAGEQCDPPDDVTCDQECQVIRVPAVCGNGRVEDGERCEPPNTAACDANCQTISTSDPDCGDGVVEGLEQCEPPNTPTCDANCKDTTGGELVNDSCASPTAITEGLHSYSNVGATTDGPEACDQFENPQIDADIWYCFTAPRDEQFTVSLCGSEYDTKMAVYFGCDCPETSDMWLGCSDDDCGAGQESRASFPGLAGQDYLIRVGGFGGPLGFDDEEGSGTVTIFGASDPDHGLGTCGPGAGECFADNGTAGCSDVAVCEATCAADASCCDRFWDGLCATKADGITNGFDACGPGSGSCDDEEGNGTTGCDDTDCCQLVCEIDPFCCLTEWDAVCAFEAQDACAVMQVCAGARGTCFDEHDAPGCNIESCCLAVCEIDELCCIASWDEVCTQLAESCDP